MDEPKLFINTIRLHERFLCLICWDKHFSYKDLAEKDSSVSIYTIFCNTIFHFSIELFKVAWIFNLKVAIAYSVHLSLWLLHSCRVLMKFFFISLSKLLMKTLGTSDTRPLIFMFGYRHIQSVFIKRSVIDFYYY